jgi:hypothetical protein
MGDQHSALRVKLSDLIEGMDFQSDQRSLCLNTTTGEVVCITDEELRAAEHDAPLEDFRTGIATRFALRETLWQRITVARCLTALRSMSTVSWSGSASR